MPIQLEKSYPPFDLTFLRTKEPGKFYAKEFDQNLKSQPIRFPWKNHHTQLHPNTLQELHQQLTKALDQPQATQILGAPTRKLLNLADPAIPHRRTKENFSFFPDPDKLSSVAYNYVVLDIDKLPPPLQTTEFQRQYEEQELTPTTIKEQVDVVLSEVFPTAHTAQSRIPNITRLSGSFGTHPDDYQHKFKAHIYIPLATPTPTSIIRQYLTQFRWVDTSIYRNPTQPVFTSRPIFETPDLDPLSTTQHDIPRLYIHYTKSPYISSSHLTDSITAIPPIPDLVDPTLHFEEKTRYEPAHDQPGYKGVFNRLAEREEQYSLATILEGLGYTKTFKSRRWLSPTSESGQPGCVIYPEGYVMDFHEKSPIHSLSDQYYPHSHSFRLFSAYDLCWMLAKENVRFPAFQNKLKQLAAVDVIYQNYWKNEIESRCTYITEDLAATQIETIIDGLISDIFYAHLTSVQQDYLFNLIVIKVKSANITGFKVSKTDLKLKYNGLREQLSLDNLDLHPSNKDLINAQAFNKMVQFSHVPNSNAFLIESYKGDRLDLVVGQDEVRRYIWHFITALSSEPSWNHNKVNATRETILASATAVDPSAPTIPISDNQYAFKSPFKNATHKDPASYNIATHKILPLSLNQGVLYTLPFTQDTYTATLKRLTDTPFADTHWGKFLTSSLDTEDNIQYLRDMMSYLFMPKRDLQQIWCFAGVTRSGKSTIKNIIMKFFPEPYSLEKTPKTMSDDATALHDYTKFTRLLVVNEFNADEVSRSINKMQIVNTLKMISGRDAVAQRAMRENPVSIKTDALPLIISNQLPVIKDQAFISRIRLLKFNHTFRDSNSGIFWNNLISELPYIFRWAITNPNLKIINGSPYLQEIRTTPNVQKDKDQMMMEINPFHAFLQTYVQADPNGWVCNADLKAMYYSFFSKYKNYAIPETDLVDQKFGLDYVKPVFPDIKSLLSSKKRTPLDGTFLIPRVRGIQGISWIDSNKMAKELSEFDHSSLS